MAKEVRFSPGEQRMLDILAKEKGPIATTDLVFKFYQGRKGGPPEYGVSSVVSVSKSLEKKTAKNKSLPYKVKRSERQGPYPIQIWLEKR